MNDRFRYRVWDKTQNKWLHFDFSTYPTYQDRIWQALTDGETFYQSTGLKDKNGKLIYEGDVLKCNRMSTKGLCEWFKDGFWVNYFINGAKRELRNMHNFYEVIGNIYENPELLEEECQK